MQVYIEKRDSHKQRKIKTKNREQKTENRKEKRAQVIKINVA